MKSDRQLDHALDMQPEMPVRGRVAGLDFGLIARSIARYGAPDVFENFMGVEKVPAVE